MALLSLSFFSHQCNNPICMIPAATRGMVRLSSSFKGRSSTIVAPSTAAPPHKMLLFMVRATTIIPEMKNAMLPSNVLP